MNNDVAIRKRTQIAQANRTMFIWIAIASALIGTAAVVGIFLFQKLTYNELVLSRKLDTVSTLDHNISVIDGLKTDIKALEVNTDLMSIKANDTDEALQVVLDALPSDANSLALGSSLQNKLLAGITGSYSLKSLQVTPVTGLETTADATTVDAGTTGTTAASSSPIGFVFSVKGDQTALHQVLQNLERSIRTIVVSRLSMDTQSGELTMTVEGHAFYQPAKTIQLTDEIVKVKK
ncbi:MAG: hypothetical protein ACOH18_03810 [Candidatus Saccharimonadaceae bacterium]